MPSLTFTVDSALLSELGEKLVETAHVALVELVKNAYDADATEVAVAIKPQAIGGPEIRIVDNGSGMTFEEVKSYWMRIATTHKRVNDLSPRFGRPRTGSKGIGRFSCRRLGATLQLETVAEVRRGAFERTKVSFDWKDFTPGTEISEVRCDATSTASRNEETGTTLVIAQSPTDEWGKRGYDFLKRQMAVLVANRGRKRRGFEEDPGFNLKLEAPGFSEQIPNLRTRLLAAGWGDLEINVDRSGEVTCELQALKIGLKTITHPRKFPDLAGLTAKIGIMPGRREEMRDREVLSQSSLLNILSEWGGVYIKHRGFRVYPYGEPGTDWLNIEQDRAVRKTALSDLLQPFAARLRGVNPQRALLSLLSEKNYIGDVEINTDSKIFEMKASREGFVGEEAIRQLRDVVRFAIDWSTIYREYYRSLIAKEDSERARVDLEQQLKTPVETQQVFSKAIKAVETEVRSLATHLPTGERQQVLRNLKTATEAIEKHEQSSQEEVRHLRLVASTSTLLLIFSHEVKALLSWLEHVSIALDRIGRAVPDKEARKVAQIREDFASVKQRFVDLLGMTSLLSVNSRTATAEKLTLSPRLKRAISAFDLITREYDIDVNTDSISETLQVGPMLEAELYAILLNVLSNAIKSVIAAGAAKKINFSAERRGSNVVISARDTGVGLKQARFEEVFAPFVADPEKRLYRGLEAKLNPEDEYIVGTGSGLGLSIVREIVAHRNGEVRFVRPTNGWNAELEITLP